MYGNTLKVACFQSSLGFFFLFHVTIFSANLGTDPSASVCGGFQRDPMHVLFVTFKVWVNQNSEFHRAADLFTMSSV